MDAVLHSHSRVQRRRVRRDADGAGSQVRGRESRTGAGSHAPHRSRRENSNVCVETGKADEQHRWITIQVRNRMVNNEINFSADFVFRFRRFVLVIA